MNPSMNARSAILSLLGNCLLLTTLLAQNPGQAELPNAPSPVASQPKQPPAPQPPTQSAKPAASPASGSSPSGGQKEPPQTSPPAPATPPAQAAPPEDETT